ncbi:MAG: RHS repeat-associated core domain-containing protein, partial [Terriglobales bacterium]
MARFVFGVPVLAGIALLAVSAYSQVQPNIESGFKAYGSYDSSKIDTVNLGNGGLTLHIPLPLAYPQRGGKVNPSFFVVSNSKSWQVQSYPDPPNKAVYYWNYGSAAGDAKIAEDPALLGPYLTNTFPVWLQRTLVFETDNNGNVSESASDYSIRDWDGSLHLLQDISSGGNGTSFGSQDTTGFHVTGSNPDQYGVTTTFVVTDRKGNVSSTVGKPLAAEWIPCTKSTTGNLNGSTTTTVCTGHVALTSFTDANGNIYGPSEDTLGRTVPLASTSSSSKTGCVSGGSTLTGSTLYSYTGSDGAAEQLQACLGNVALSTDFGQSGVLEFPSSHSLSTPFSMIVTLILPNTTKWTFSYDSYGNVTTLGLPTGGSISYTWETISIPTCDSAAAVSRAVASRTFTNGTTSYTWNYTWGTWSGGTVTNVVTDPLGNDVVHVFKMIGCPTYETATKSYQGSSKTGPLLQEIDTTYSTGDGIVPTYIQTTDYTSGLVKAIAKSYDPGYGTNRPIFGNVTSETDYDWGPGAPGGVLRQIATTYEFQNNSNYLTANLPDLPASVVISNAAANKCSETDYTYDSGSYLTTSGVTEQHVSPPGVVRGNLSSTTQQLSSTPCQSGATWSPVTSYTNMYDTGEIYESIDPLGNLAATYGYSPTFYGAYPTTVTNALGQATNYNYDLSTGLMTSVTDPNQQETTWTYDSMFRVLTASYPDHGGKSVTYHDATPPVSATLTTLITSNVSEVQTNVFDYLGRFSESQLNSDPEGADYQDTTYDAVGNKATTSNPYRKTSDSTYGITTNAYDPLHRVKQVTEPDGSIIKIAYCGNATLVTDEAGHWRRSKVDGLNRLFEVDEPNSPTATVSSNGCPAPGDPIWVTTYGYDPLGNLLSVLQSGSRQRTFMYDSLSRLLTANNPESGTISYGYDNDGNVTSKIAPMPNQTRTATVTTTRKYDALNRVTSVTYSDGITPANFYDYDVAPGSGFTNIVGRLVNSYNQYGGSTSAQATVTFYSYDAMGRVIREWEQTPSLSPNGTWVCQTYDLAGNLASINPAGVLMAGSPTACNPTGTTISYAHDAGNHLSTITSSLSDAQHPATLYSLDPSVGYWANGAIRKASFGNGLTDAPAINNRLQPCRVNVNTGGNYFLTCTDATPSGSVLDVTMGYNAGSSDNGNVVSWTAVGDQTFSRTYGYDQLNRIQSMADSAAGQACKGLSWTLDQWGNLTAQTQTAGTCYGFQATPTTNNQLVGYQYDAAGNMTYDGSHYYTYDAENRIVQVDSGSTASYVYNENGKRARKNTGGGFTEYFYGSDGKVSNDYNGTWAVQYVYAGSDLVAEYTNGTTEFVHTDHLGSTRLVTGVNQALLDNMDYLPFGKQVEGASVTTHKFTGKERDTESGNDYFGARYYASSMGRFMSVDPAFESEIL